MPTRLGSIFHSFALLRTSRTARCPSARACSAILYGEPFSRARRYFKTNAAMPWSASHFASFSPS